MLNVLVGAHGTGKSTLLEYLKGKVPYYVTDGFSRPVSRAFIGSIYNATLEQKLINELILWAWKNNLDQNVIAARSLVDVIVYSKYYVDESDEFTSILVDQLRKDKDKVNFFYIPIEFDLVKDGFRYENKTDRVAIDINLKNLLDSENIMYTTLTGSVEDRFNIISKYL